MAVSDTGKPIFLRGGGGCRLVLHFCQHAAFSMLLIACQGTHFIELSIVFGVFFLYKLKKNPIIPFVCLLKDHSCSPI